MKRDAWALIAAATLIVGFGAAKLSAERAGKERLGGDAEISGIGETSPVGVAAYLSMYGRTRSYVMTLSADAKADESDAALPSEPLPVTLKAVDRPYPLYGKLSWSDKARGSLFGPFSRNTVHGAIVSRELLEALHIEPGEHFTIGGVMFVASAVITGIPDDSAGERSVIVRHPALYAVLKNTPGYVGEVVHRYRVKLPPTTNFEQWADRFNRTFEESGWKARHWKEHVPAPLRVITWPILLAGLFGVLALLIFRIIRPKARG